MFRPCLTLVLLAYLLPGEWLGSGAQIAAPPVVEWREAAQLLPLFTPPAARQLYHTAVTPRPLDEVLAAIRADSSLNATPGAFEPQLVNALDAFGLSGRYNRWSLARLYGAGRTRVARGPRIEDGQVVEAWTLISPYPDVAMSRLEEGTLRIVLRLR
jgi:hypothetical protein